MRMTTIAALVFVCSQAAWAGGTVNVSFIEPQRYTDAGERSHEYSPNILRQLEQQMQALGQRYLADGQVLTLEVTDVDLAGELRPARRGDWVRVARGKADWPRIALRYKLEVNGQVLRSGEETLADLDYSHNIPLYSTYPPLSWERLMLEYWFKTRFSEAQ